MSAEGWKLISSYEITHYACGVVAGQTVALRQDLKIKDDAGRFSGAVIRQGEPWIVLKGSAEDRDVVFLLAPDGKRHTWSNDADFLKAFEVVAPFDM